MLFAPTKRLSPPVPITCSFFCSLFCSARTSASSLSLLLALAATTVAVALQSEELIEREEVPDIKSASGEIFSDGCCYASHRLLQLLHDAMQSQHSGERPSMAQLLAKEPSGSLPASAVQVRLGGIKGVLSVKMGIEGRKLFWRKSMKKFDADIMELEICEWATWHPAYLNRYIIMLLEHRGVPYDVLRGLQEAYLETLSRCLSDPWIAQQLLHSIGAMSSDGGEGDDASRPASGANSGALGAALGMLRMGVCMEDDPFLLSIMTAICTSLRRGVVEKARVLVDEGARLMGVTDEDEVLNYGEVYLSVKPPWSDEAAGAQVISGPVAVYRDPGMHPGGVRLLMAVDRPELAHHMPNQIVFPSRGPRPHPAEMSGGDCDGDKYLILWDASIIGHLTPMAPEPKAAVALHKQKPLGAGEPAPWVRHMPKPPAPMPSEHILTSRVANEDRKRHEGPHVPTVADHLGHAPPRRRSLTEEEMQAEGEVLEAVREATRDEEAQRFDTELSRLQSNHRRKHEAATLEHAQRQEKEAVNFYLYFGKRQNLGQISNLWLAYADKFGCMHEDTLELCRLAQLAVQFVKTGMPVNLDRRRFNLAVRPDYMRHSKQGPSYRSHKALGKLYRAAMTAPALTTSAAAAAAAHQPASSGDAPGSSNLGRMLRVEGYESFYAEACRSRDAYESHLLYLLEIYGVETEGELLSGRVAKFDHDLVRHCNQRDTEETLRRAVYELWTANRQRFEESVEEAVSAAGGGASAPPLVRATLRQDISPRVAYAWYVAGYRLSDAESPTAAIPPSRSAAPPLYSFPWVAWKELMAALQSNKAIERVINTRTSATAEETLLSRQDRVCDRIQDADYADDRSSLS